MNTKRLSYTEMQNFLSNPETRISDLRMIEAIYDFTTVLQALLPDGTIVETNSIMNQGKYKIAPLDLFRLYYYNSRRMNPMLYGTFDTPSPTDDERNA